MFMETSILNNHPTLKDIEERFSKTVDSVVSSFQIEGIEFSSEELEEMITNVKEDLKI